MDQRHHPLETNFDLDREREERGDSDDFIDLDRLFTIIVRRAWMVVACMVAAIILGGVYLVFAPRTYTAATSILLDNNLARYASDEPSPVPQEAQSDSEVSSQIEILKSQQLALTVVDKLNLDENVAFMNPPESPVTWLKGTVKSVATALLPRSAPETEDTGDNSARAQAAALLQQSLEVERSGRSFAMQLYYSSNDPQLAGAIAKTYAESYLSDQLNANFEATQRATVWLQERLSNLKDSARKASMEVARYKAQNGLTSTRGELVSEQQLSDINSQLILAQADLASASARYNQYEQIVESGRDNAVKNATVSNKETDNSVIDALKGRYLTVSNRADQIEQQFGKDHPQAVGLRKEQENLADQIYAELKHITTGYKNEYDVAKSRVDSLQENIARLTRETSDANKSLVHLKGLEQRADTLNTLYQSFLSRYEQAQQQQSFPIAKARVISAASTPTAPSSPSKTLVLGLSMVLGLMAGAGLAALSEFSERFFRLESEVRSSLGLKFLGYLPILSTSLFRKPGKLAGNENPPLLNPAMRVAVDAPGSAYAETLRNARLAADVVLQGAHSKVIGIVSALPREGKSTVAANLAGLIAASGSKTLLIDADLRHPGLTRQMLAPPERGLVDAIAGEESWATFVKVDRRTRLAVLPSVARGNFAHTSELLASAGMAELLRGARDMFEYIVVDLPPSAAVVDAKAFEPEVDGFIVVAEWGSTPRALLRSLLRAEPRMRSKVLGVILNKTDMKKLARYASIGGSERYMNRYADYYVSSKPTGRK